MRVCVRVCVWCAAATGRRSSDAGRRLAGGYTCPPTLDSGDELRLRALLRDTLVDSAHSGPSSGTTRRGRVPSSSRAPSAEASARSTRSTYATARSTRSAGTTRDSFVTACGVRSRRASTGDSFVSAAESLSGLHGCSTRGTVEGAAHAHAPRSRRCTCGQGGSALCLPWGRTSPPACLSCERTLAAPPAEAYGRGRVRGTECSLFSRGERSTRWTLGSSRGASRSARSTCAGSACGALIAPAVGGGDWRALAERMCARREEASAPWQDAAAERAAMDAWWAVFDRSEGSTEDAESEAVLTQDSEEGRVSEWRGGGCDAGNAEGFDERGRRGGRWGWVRNGPLWETVRAAQRSCRSSTCSLFSVDRRGTAASVWELQWPPPRVTQWLEEGPPDWTAEDAAAESGRADWGFRDSLRRRKDPEWVDADSGGGGSLRRRMAVDAAACAPVAVV